jgi:hypothetical protein
MGWLTNLNPFKKKEEPAKSVAQAQAPAGLPALPKELADSPEAKGMMAMFYRKWKDPAFIKQFKTLAAYMQRDGVDARDVKQVKAWLEKNKEAIEKGLMSEPPAGAAKPATFVKSGPDVGRNDPCHCGSGKKFKKCHGLTA